MMPNTNLSCFAPCSKEKRESGQCGCHVRTLNKQFEFLLQMPLNEAIKDMEEINLPNQPSQ